MTADNNTKQEAMQNANPLLLGWNDPLPDLTRKEAKSLANKEKAREKKWIKKEKKKRERKNLLPRSDEEWHRLYLKYNYDS